jgi:AraC-like DNA-binding protein
LAASTVHRITIAAAPVAGVYCTVADSGRTFTRHWHDTYGFGLLEAGAQRSASGRGVVDAHAGQIITTNPGEVHDGRPLGDGPRRWRMVYVEPSVLHAFVFGPHELERGRGLEVAHPVLDDTRLRSALRRVFDGIGAGASARRPRRACSTLAAEEAFAEACGLLAERHSNRAHAKDPAVPVHRVRELLAERSGDPPTLAELAAVASLSRWQLVRRFGAVYGMSPCAWLMRYRAERARGLIAAGASLSAAAQDSGFADQSHMTRSFVRQFGFTPGAWRRAMRDT